MSGRGTGILENKTFLGIHIIPIKEIILAIVKVQKVDQIVESIAEAAKLDQHGVGLGIGLNTKTSIWICHLLGVVTSPDDRMEGETPSMGKQKHSILYDLIVTIVNKGDSQKVVDAVK